MNTHGLFWSTKKPFSPPRWAGHVTVPLCQIDHEICSNEVIALDVYKLGGKKIRILEFSFVRRSVCLVTINS